jgi:hypothetical protein
MMLKPPHFALRWQQIFEMTFPPGRVLPLTVFSCRRPIQHRLDPAADPARCFWFRSPDRLYCLQDEPNIDRLDGEITKYRIDISAKAARPLRSVPWVTPASLVRFDIALGTFGKGHCRGRSTPLLGSLGPAILDWVDTIEPLMSTRSGALPRLSKRDRVQWPQAHFACFAIESEAVDPTLGTAGTDL